MQGGIAVLDFGSQYTQLIAKRLRKMGVYAELHPYNVDIQKLKDAKVQGIILSGGPNSVNEEWAPHRPLQPLLDVAPLLGICYGMQLIVKDQGGVVEKAKAREYGLMEVSWSQKWNKTTPDQQKVWMSHGDVIKALPDHLEVLAQSSNGHPAAIRGEKIWALQFHPEVTHTEGGSELLEEFAVNVCGAEKKWTAEKIVDRLLDGIRAQVGEESNVLCALSGGVDSTVVGTLLTKALGPERVHCVFVNNGLLRKNEFEQVLADYKKIGLNVNGIDAEKEFLDNLSGLSDPEEKRKTIGRVFIEVFQEAVKDLDKMDYLAQGTLYPDVIESVSPRGTSVTIKSHHNVGGLPEKMNLKLVEPLRELFKDEVREIGAELGLAREALWRHPFPGPGLAIRVLGEISRKDLDTIKDCDAIYIEELKKNGLYDQIWQAFCVLLPVRTVGVQGDARTYEKVLALRAVTSHDGMTADWFDFSGSFLRHVSNRITNEVDGVNRVVYDVTSKPPGTIEWE